MSPKVTIIIPFYNTDVALFEACLASIKGQIYKNINVVIVNDGSTNVESVSCAKNASEKYGYSFITTKNMGVSNARNEGLREANGEYVFFLDSDDIIEPECIDELVKVATEQNYNIIFDGIKNSSTQRIGFSEKNIKLNLYDDTEFTALNLEALRSQGVLIDAKIAKSQSFNVNLRKCEDTDYMLRVLADERANAYVLGNGRYRYIQNNNSVMHDYSIGEIMDSVKSRECLLKTLRQLVAIDGNSIGYLRLLNLNAAASALIKSNVEFKTFSSELKKIYRQLNYKKISTKYILRLKKRLSKRRVFQFTLLNMKLVFLYYQLGAMMSGRKNATPTHDGRGEL